MKELNTLAIKKWSGNYGGINPTIDASDGVCNGDMAIDTSQDPEHVWRCLSNTAGASEWMPISAIEKTGIATGLLQGGIISINSYSNTTFDISAGEGIIVDQTDPTNPMVQEVVWSDFTNVSATYLTTDLRTNIFISNSASIVQQTTPITFENVRDYIIIGRLVHPNKSIITNALPLPRVIYDNAFQVDDISQALGNINIEGNTYSANGNNLSIDKVSGSTYRLGANYDNSLILPNITTDDPAIALNFYYRYRDGSGGFKSSPLTNVVDSANYDDGSVSSPVSLPTGTNKWTIQRVYFFPGTNNTFLTYGQTVYNTLADAKAAMGLESPVIDPYFVQDGSLRAMIAVKKGTTNLSDTLSNIFRQTGKLNDIMGGSSTGGDVVGPGSAVNDSLVRFDGTTGKLVKDGANIVATDDGFIGMGTVAPESPLHIVATSNNSGGNSLQAEVYGTGGGAGLQCRRGRGTAGSPSSVLAEDTLGYISGRGYGTTGMASAGRSSIELVAEENFTDSAQGARIVFNTTANGTTTRQERVRINNVGQWIGGKSNVASITTDTNATSSDLIFICNATSNAININLPASASISGKEYIFKKIDSTANNVVVIPNGSETIDGDPNMTLTTQYESKNIVAQDGNWWEI